MPGKGTSRARAVAAFTTIVFAGCAAAAHADTVWTGRADGSRWSLAGNWSAGVPSRTADNGRLTFPPNNCGYLTPCNLVNDVGSLAANRLVFGPGSHYSLTGSAVRLGTGGITAVEAVNGNNGGKDVIDLPLLLRGSQTWSLGRLHSLQINSAAGDVSDALTLVSGRYDFFSVRQFLEGGPLTVSGDLFPSPGATVNSLSGSPVVITSGATLYSTHDVTTGPLTTSGRLSLDLTKAATATPLVSSTGPVRLGGTLALENIDAQGVYGPCPAAGQTFTLVRAAGGLSGTFSNAPDQTVLPCGPTPGRTRMRIAYNTAQGTVTATAVPIAAAGPSSRTKQITVRQGKSPKTMTKHVTFRRGSRLAVGFYGNWYDSGYAWTLTRKPRAATLKLAKAKTVATHRCCGFPEQHTQFFTARKPGKTTLVYTLRGPGGRPKNAGRLTVHVRVRGS